jgi:hypothetical protein
MRKRLRSLANDERLPAFLVEIEGLAGSAERTIRTAARAVICTDVLRHACVRLRDAPVALRARDLAEELAWNLIRLMGNGVSQTPGKKRRSVYAALGVQKPDGDWLKEMALLLSGDTRYSTGPQVTRPFLLDILSDYLIGTRILWESLSADCYVTMHLRNDLLDGLLSEPAVTNPKE